MTSRETWKAMERKVAKLLGGIRTPLSGINSGHTGADVIHPYFFVECKYRENYAIKKLYDDTTEIEKKETFIAVREIWIEELEIAIARHADHIKRDKAEMARYKKEIVEAKEEVMHE